MVPHNRGVFVCVQDKNNPTRPAHLDQRERRFVKFGGGFGDEQLAWMRTELEVSLPNDCRSYAIAEANLLPSSDCIATWSGLESKEWISS